MKNITLFAKISGKSIFNWFSLFIPGFILSMSFFSIALYLLYSDGGGLGHAAAHVDGKGASIVFMLEFFRLALTKPFPFTLFIMSMVMVPVYYSMATKYSLSAAFYDIWNGSLKEWFFNKIIYYIDIVRSKSVIVSKTDKKMSEKMRIIQAIRQDTDASKFQKKLLTFVMEKIHLEDADFDDPNTKYSDIVIEKVKAAASEFFYPSRKLIIYLYLFHILLFILAMVNS